jgi:hypothetical protein
VNRDDAIAQLCPELRAILDAELAAGNSIAEVAEAWGLGVLLVLPFRLTHAVSDRITFRPVNDPHYWLAEYNCAEPKQFIACRFP